MSESNRLLVLDDMRFPHHGAAENGSGRIQGGPASSVDSFSDNEDSDTELVRLKPVRPHLIWQDVQFQHKTCLALNKMRKNRHFVDVTLEIGQHGIPAHRAILAAASPYFMELFTTENPSLKEVGVDGGMRYTLNGGFHKDSIERLVDYAYTSRLDVPGDLVKPLYMASLRLKMDRVTVECARFLANHLDISSCLDLRSMPGVSPELFALENNGKTENQNPSPQPINPIIDTVIEASSDLGDNNSINLMAKVDDFIGANLEQLKDTRELMSLPRICIEILHLSQEEKDAALVEPLCQLVLDWINEQWFNYDDPCLDDLTSRRYMLFLSTSNTFQDCEVIEVGSTNDSEVIQDYKKVNQHLMQQKKRRQVSGGSFKPAKPRELLYTRHINQDDHAKQANEDDGWKVITCGKLDGKSILALVTIDRNLATLSIIQKVNRPSAPGNGVSNKSIESTDNKARQTYGPLSIPSRRSPSIDRDLEYSSVANMPLAKCSEGAANLQGKLVVCGGFNRGECLNGVDWYDPQSNEWKPLPPMLAKRGRFDIVTDGGDTLYAVAGSNGHAEECSAEKFQLKTGKWSSIANLPMTLSNIGLCYLHGHVYCVGGTYGPAGTKYCFKLNSSETNWDRIPNLLTGRFQAATSSFHDKIWVVGGCDGWKPLRTVEVYDPETNAWCYGPEMGTARRGAGLVVWKEHLLVVGGSDGTSSLCSTEILDTGDSGSYVWKPGPTMTTCRSNVAVAVVDDKVWACGGFSGKVFLNTVEYLDQTTLEWTTFVALQQQQQQQHQHQQTDDVELSTNDNDKDKETQESSADKSNDHLNSITETSVSETETNLIEETREE